MIVRDKVASTRGWSEADVIRRVALAVHLVALLVAAGALAAQAWWTLVAWALVATIAGAWGLRTTAQEHDARMAREARAMTSRRFTDPERDA